MHLSLQDRSLVPPCIKQNSSGTVDVRLEVEDRSQRPGLTRITADSVRMHIAANIGHEGAQGVGLVGVSGCVGGDVCRCDQRRFGQLGEG